METKSPTESVDRNPYTQERLAMQFIQLIEKQKLQYKDIAEKLGFHYTYISYIQNPRYYDKVPHHVWEKIRHYLGLNTEPANLKSNAVLAGTVSAGSDYDIDKDLSNRDKFLSVPSPLENMDIVLRKKRASKKPELDDKNVDININLTITVGKKKIRCTKTFRV